MRKRVVNKIVTDDVFVTKLVVVVSIVIIMSGLFFVNFFPASNIRAFSQQSQDTLAQSNVVPQARLIYNNHYYDMSPFVFVNNRQLSKIQFPSSAGDFQNGPTLLKGSPLSFQFSKQPIRVDALVADYESDIPELFMLKGIDTNTFELSGPSGLYNIEVHAIYADGQYTSHTILANIVDNGPISSGAMSTKSTLPVTDNIDNGNRITNEQSCNRHMKFAPQGALSNNMNLPQRGINMPTWSTKGIDILSFASRTSTTPQPEEHANALVNENPSLRLDLGADNLICNIGLMFGNGENSVNYFTIQISTDGAKFKDLGVVETTPVIGSGEALYNFPDLPAMTRYIKIANLGNVPLGSVSIDELTVSQS
jgi:hypothetical protein